MANYSDDDLLALSGIQHIAFCPRQFALIHIEQQWQENLFTFSGRELHERADDPFFVEARGVSLISRSVPLLSRRLGLYGIADVVEFHKDDCKGISFAGREGLWKPYPVEYKRGQPKKDDFDIVQLCAQAMCLEEMLGVCVAEGALFYGKIRRRQVVQLDDTLRQRVVELSFYMHELYNKGITPIPVKTSACESCSIHDLCLPEIASKRDVRVYLEEILKGEETA